MSSRRYVARALRAALVGRCKLDPSLKATWFQPLTPESAYSAFNLNPCCLSLHSYNLDPDFDAIIAVLYADAADYDLNEVRRVQVEHIRLTLG